MPLISVIVPCYNQAQYLDECLQSVLDQTFQDWECIIVNDGSPDNTEEVAKRWLEKDARFRYIYKENGGLSSARNAGLNLTKGEYIQLLDCDDYIFRDKFELQIRDLRTYEVSISDYVHVNCNTEMSTSLYITPFSLGKFNMEDIVLKWEKNISIPCHCIIYRNSNLRFNENLKNHEDWVFWVLLFNQHGKIAYNKNILAAYRYSAESMSRNVSGMKIGFLEACRFLISYFQKGNEQKFIKLLQQKILLIDNRPILSLREKVASSFPSLFNLYKKLLS